MLSLCLSDFSCHLKSSEIFIVIIHPLLKNQEMSTGSQGSQWLSPKPFQFICILIRYVVDYVPPIYLQFVQPILAMSLGNKVSFFSLSTIRQLNDSISKQQDTKH